MDQNYEARKKANWRAQIWCGIVAVLGVVAAATPRLHSGIRMVSGLVALPAAFGFIVSRAGYIRAKNAIERGYSSVVSDKPIVTSTPETTSQTSPEYSQNKRADDTLWTENIRHDTYANRGK